MSLPAKYDVITFVFTANRAKAKPFYTDVLGLKLVRENEYAAVFDMGGATLRLTDIAGHVPSPHTVLGWQVDNIRTAMAALKAKGVTFNTYEDLTDAEGIWAAPEGGVKICWFNDPEGNNLSLTEG